MQRRWVHAALQPAGSGRITREERVLQDIRFAFRQLVKSPGFTIVAVLTLALAIGSSTAIFSAVDAVLLHPLPYPDPDQLVIAGQNIKHYSLAKIASTPFEFVTFRKMATCFSQIAAVRGLGSATLTGGAEPESVVSAAVTANIFPMLGIKPIVGGLFSADDEQYGKGHVAIITAGLWRRRYGADPSIIGKNIEINRESYRVVGVIEPILEYRFRADVWTPLAFSPADLEPRNGLKVIDVIGRLKTGVMLERAQAEFRGIAARMAEQNPIRYGKNMGFSVDLDPLAERQAGSLKMPLLVLMAAVGVVMLIACANISNLLLARATARRREVGIRTALGAARSRVVRQLLTESLLLSAIAGTAGVLLAMYGLRLYGRFGPPDLIRGAQPAMNGWVMAFSVLVSMAASVLFGLGPALETSSLNLTAALKEGSRGSSGGGRFLRESMVVAEVAASLILVIGAALLVRSFIRLERADPGFRPEQLLTVQIALPATLYKQPAQRLEFQNSLLERVASLPGVKSVAAAEYIPFVSGFGEGPFEIVGHPRDPSAPSPVVVQSRASAGYFETMGIPILRGRGITRADDRGALPVAVVDETLVKKYFTDRDPIGIEIQVPIPDVTCKILGIVGAVKYSDLAGMPLPTIYYSGPQLPSAKIGLAIKAERDPLSLVNPLRHEVAALDSSLPVATQTMQQALDDSLVRQRFSIQLMTVFAAVAALLAAMGIYGVLASLVDRRRREIGIRMALGARPADVLALVLRQGSLPVALGVALGVSGALGLTRLLTTLLYEVSATDPLTFTSVSSGLLAVGVLAMIVPARRASRVDPVEALRHE